VNSIGIADTAKKKNTKATYKLGGAHFVHINQFVHDGMTEGFETSNMLFIIRFIQPNKEKLMVMGAAENQRT
jgi:hypothetical protein